ncbi:cyclohexanone 1,2-monooxygenase [Trichoderma asperellum]|uniref:Cyclohexanone 1,2-monooxygenase n=1 Tax=Trichoderma asperellum TaxID=101201 RepID=A0A6V8QHG1_TRIAP|nr:cyclohexanone 1,2-monooxygenase [Trichoderma asperellum]
MQSFDAIVIGAGFAGINQLYQLRQLGLSVKLFEKAPDVGGVWYWNQWPNATSDTPSEVYRYSWDKEDLLTYPWPTHVLPQKETQAYMNHVVERHNLRQHMQFSSELKSATFYKSDSTWTILLSTGETFKATYLILATGRFNKTVWPSIPGQEIFAGEQYHTGIWPENRDLKGKRVGIVGTGSSGAAILVGLAKEAKQVVSFQRSAQYVIPINKDPVPAEYREKVNKNYEDVFRKVRRCGIGSGFDPVPADYTTFSVSAEEREKVFEAAWNSVRGLAFTFDTFSDVMTNEAANRELCQFFRGKIAQIVQDPEKREKLMPPAEALYDKRPVCSSGYYEAFNQENVDVVNFKKTPLVGITEKGIQTTDKLYELDVIIYATGYESDGTWADINITGPQGKTLGEHWTEGSTSYLGIFVIGPQSSLANIPSHSEFHAEMIGKLISKAETMKKEKAPASGHKTVLVDATQQAEDDWVKVCNAVIQQTVYYKGESYLFSDHNTVRKPKSGRHVLWFMGGYDKYIDKVQEAVDTYRGFVFAY